MLTLNKAKNIEDWMINLRRDFHKHPELSNKEFRTSKIVKEELEKLGVEIVPVGETGIVGIIKGKPDGKVVALRADMDALPVTEDTGLSYTSENEGAAHACGHDCHTAMLLGAAKILSDMKDELNGTVKLLFQPGEETATGATAMIEGNALKNPDVDAIVGMHIDTFIPSGKVVIQEGPLMASGDEFNFKIIGKQCHGSAPWQGIDANVCAAAVIQGIQTIISRRNDARSPLVINVGTVNGGERFNITSGEVYCTGTVRGFNEENRRNIPHLMERMIKGICMAYGCEYKFDYKFLVAGVNNNAEAAKKVREYITNTIGEENVIKSEKMMASEDFSAYQLSVPGVFMILGAGNKEKDCIYPLHSNHLKIDEDALPLGAASYVEAALALLG